jgi:hypothetical protein
MDDWFANGPAPCQLITPLINDREINILQLSDHLIQEPCNLELQFGKKHLCEMWQYIMQQKFEK